MWESGTQTRVSATFSSSKSFGSHRVKEWVAQQALEKAHDQQIYASLQFMAEQAQEGAS
jgi:hypothetical protein